MSRPRSLRSIVVSPNNSRSDAPPSPTFSDMTNVSTMNLTNGPDIVITRSNLRQSMLAYEELLHTSANYRGTLMAMSKATAAFASAMDACSSLKGCSYESGSRFQAASGLHHLMANQWHVLGDTMEKKFEKPLKHYLETYQTVVTERSTSYERVLREKSNQIHRTEQQNLGRKGRNLQTFREALASLQRQVDELDRLKVEHYQQVLDHEEEVWDIVQGKVCLVVRSSMDVFDRFSAKASDPILEPMLQSVPDPFDSYGPPKTEDQIFSILAPLSLVSNASTPTSGTPELESRTLPGATSSWLDSPSPSLEWANLPSSSPPHAMAPHSAGSPSSVSPPSRRHPPSSSQSTIRRSDAAKLQGMLSPIFESKDSASNHPATAPPGMTHDPASPVESEPPTPVNGRTSRSRSSWEHFIAMGRTTTGGSNDGITTDAVSGVSRHSAYSHARASVDSLSSPGDDQKSNGDPMSLPS